MFHRRHHSPDRGLDPAERLRAARLIAAALILGQLIFVGIIAWIGPRLATGPMPPLTWGAAILGAVAVPASLAVRAVRMSRAHAQEGWQRLAGVMTATIAGYALLEGAGLLNLTAWLVTGSPIPNAAVAGLLIGVQILLFPQPAHFDPRKG